MAAGTLKSVNVTNIEASPITALDRKVGVKKVLIDKVAVATTNTDDVGDKILFGPIPSNAVITSIKILNDDLDSHDTPTLAADVGLYYSSGSVIDADCFATAITTLQAAGVTGAEVRFEVDDIVDIVKEAWEAGGLSSNPGGLFYIGLTVTAAAATGEAGDIVLVVEYM